MTTYYMRADGTASDKGDATSAAAAGTSMSMSVHNSETFSAGDIIVLSDAGGVFRGSSGAVMTPPSSGASGNPIVYQADGTPTVSGALDLTSSTYKWTASGSGTNEYYCELSGGGDPSISAPTDVFVDQTLATEATAGSLSDGEWDYGDNDTLGYSTVYYRSDAGDPDGLSIQIEANQANNGLNLNGDDYITVDGINFQGGQSNGIVMAGGLTGITIKNCKCRYNSTNGIQIFDTMGAVGSDITIDDNELAYNGQSGLTMLEENNNVTIKNNNCHNNTFPGETGNVGGINVKAEDDARPDNLLIENNTCHDNGPTGVAAGSGFGFYIDTIGSNLIVRYNKAYNNNADGFVYEWTDSGTLYYNLAYSNDRHGFAFIRRCNSNTFYNNTSYGNGVTDSSGSNYIFNGSSEGPTETESNNTFKNNIGLGAAGKEVRVHSGWVNDGTNGSGNVYDKNILADQSGNFHNWNGTLYSSAIAWQDAASGVTNTDGSDPLVVDAANADFRLNKKSPAINRGVDVGLTQDIDGNKVPSGSGVDLGAYERQYAKKGRSSVVMFRVLLRDGEQLKIGKS